TIGVPVERPVVDTSVAPTARTPLYDIVAETIGSTVLPALHDPMVAHQARAALRVLRHLSLADRVGAQIEQQTKDDLTSLLGVGVVSLTAGMAQLAQRIDDGEF